MKCLTVAGIILIGLAAFAQVISSGKHNNFDAELHISNVCDRHLYIKPLLLELVPALTTPLPVVLVMQIAKLLMVTVFVEQTVTSTVTVALMSAVLNVNEIIT